MRAALVAVCVLAAVVPAARARADTRADALFKQGKSELAAKHYEAACKAFKGSLDLDPTAIGTMLNLAHCYEEWGRLATGMTWYRNAKERAEKVHDDRLKGIEERIAALDPQVPRLTVNVGGPVAGTTVTLDGEPLAKDKLGTEMQVDPGPHLVVVRRGSDKRERTVPLEAGGSSEIRIEAPPEQEGAATTTATTATTTGATTTAATTAASTTTVTATASADPGHGKRVAGLVLGAGGVAAIAVASIVTLRAKSRYDAALTGDCGGSKASCNDEGLSATASARKEANVASFVFGGGIALAAAGAYLYLTSRHPASTEHALRVVPSTNGLAVVGGF